MVWQYQCIHAQWVKLSLYSKEYKSLSLVGSLRDLGLGDIFQIVAMSRRSGTLQLVAGHYTGRVIFDDGKVIAADCQQDGKGTPLGERLVAKSIVPTAVVATIMESEQVAAAQLASGETEQIVSTETLLQAQQIELEKLQGPLQGMLLGLIQTMFTWREGHFSFVLHTPETPKSHLQLHTSLVVLQQGINPQFLAIEGARLEDEQDEQTPSQPGAGQVVQADSTTQVTAITTSSPPESQSLALHTAASPQQASAAVVWQSTLLIVDDDPSFLKQLASTLQGKAKHILLIDNVVDALAQIATIVTPMVVLADLVMPGHDGQRVLGGLELLEYIHAHAPTTKVILFSDYASDNAAERAASFGITQILRKPRKAQLLLQEGVANMGPAMASFAAKIMDSLQQCHDERGQLRREKLILAKESDAIEQSDPTSSSAAVDGNDPGPLADLQAEIEDLLADAPWLRAEPMAEEPYAAVLTPLRAMLTELRDRSQANSISLLILRYASALAERAALFLVTKWAYAGLGGFSPFFPAEQFVMRVRRLQLPVDHQSVFDKVVGFRTLWRAPLHDSPAHRALMAGMGGTWHNHEVVVAPLISNDRVAALLWCDNPSGQPLAAMDGMEIFLQQAGLVMDRIVLERKLAQERDRNS